MNYAFFVLFCAFVPKSELTNTLIWIINIIILFYFAVKTLIIRSLLFILLHYKRVGKVRVL